MSKTDYEQLKGILEEFDKETVLKVLREQDLDIEKLQQPMIKHTKDFPDLKLGPKSKAGDKNVVSKEDYMAQSKIERIIAVTGEEPDFLPVHFLECGWNFSKPVARILVRGYWWGTGFLVSRSLFMTNNHVIPDENKGSLAEAEFNYQLDHDANPTPKDVFYGDPDSFFHTNPSLDYTIMRLKPHRIFPLAALAQDPWRRYFAREQSPEELDLGSLTATLVGRATLYLSHHAGDSWGHIPLVDKAMTVEQRLNIIQHPRTRYKEVCLHDNRITEIFANAIHYTTDTENGSSGSPVFDNEWELLAIHHAAGDYHAGKWIDNEGMRIDSIIDDLQNSLRGTSDEGVLTELGIP
jgi:endonuclease G